MIKIGRKIGNTIQLDDSNVDILNHSTTKFILASNSNDTEEIEIEDIQELIPVNKIQFNQLGFQEIQKPTVQNFDFNTLGRGNNGILNELGKKLLNAAADGAVDVIKALLEKGSPFIVDWLGTSPLHLAAQNDHANVCDLLLRSGICVDARTKVDRTPLHVAASEGYLEVVSVLVHHQADINCKDLLNMTPLHWAVQNGHYEVVEFLVRNQADTTVKNKFDLTVLDIAMQNRRTDIIDFLFGFGDEATTAATDNLVLQLQEDNNSAGICENVNLNETIGDDNNIDSEFREVVNGKTGNNVTSPILTDVATNEEEYHSLNTAIHNNNNNSNNSSQNGVPNQTEEQLLEPEHDDNTSFSSVNDEFELSASTLRMLEEHGLTMIPPIITSDIVAGISDSSGIVDDSGGVLNSAMESGRSVVLTEVGKEVLNSLKQSESIQDQQPRQTNRSQLHPAKQQRQQSSNVAISHHLQSSGSKRKIITVTPQEFLAMTNSVRKSKIKFLPVPNRPTLRRVVMKKPKMTTLSNISIPNTIPLRPVGPTIIGKKQNSTELEVIMGQLIEAKKTIEEYKIKLHQKEQEAERYKMQLKLLLDS